MKNIVRRAAFWMNRRRHAEELAAEMEQHCARRQAALEAAGLPAPEAAVRSRREMGNVTLAREDAREAWTFVALERAWRDAKNGVRALRREPGFALAALVTLTLGCVSTITVFSVANAELWRPLPFPEPERLVTARVTHPTQPFVVGISAPDLPTGAHRVASSITPRCSRRRAASCASSRPKRSSCAP